MLVGNLGVDFLLQLILISWVVWIDKHELVVIGSIEVLLISLVLAFDGNCNFGVLDQKLRILM